MDWKTMLAYVTGEVDENLLLRIEYLVAENLSGQNIPTGLFAEIYIPPLRPPLLLILDLSMTDNQGQLREKWEGMINGLEDDVGLCYWRSR